MGKTKLATLVSMSGCFILCHGRPSTSLDGIKGLSLLSSLCIPAAAMAKTVISPNVSKPRKSTRIMFTTLVPPPPVFALAIKKSEIDSAGVVRMAKFKVATIPPIKLAIIISRKTRWPLDARLVFCGIKKSARIIKIMLTTSTTN